MFGVGACDVVVGRAVVKLVAEASVSQLFAPSVACAGVCGAPVDDVGPWQSRCHVRRPPIVLKFGPPLCSPVGSLRGLVALVQCPPSMRKRERWMSWT